MPHGCTRLQGPYHLVEGGFGAITYYPIFIPVDDPAETWGCNITAYNCSAPLCYRPETKEKFWGIAQAIINMEPLELGTDERLQRLMRLGYLYRLTRPPTAVMNREIKIAASDRLPNDPVVITIPAYDTMWMLEIAPEGGWKPEWRDPCIAAVVVGSALVSVLLMQLMLTQEQHAGLLREMLPPQAIKELKRGHTAFVEHFEWYAGQCSNAYTGMKQTNME